MARTAKFVRGDIDRSSVRTPGPSQTLKTRGNEARPAQSDSLVDLDSLLKETCASVREDVRRMKRLNRRDRKEKKDAKKAKIEGRNADGDSLSKGKEAEISEEEMRTFKERLDGLEAASRRLHNKDLPDAIMDILMERSKKEKAEKKVKIQAPKKDRPETDSLSKSKGAAVVGKISEEEKRVYKQQYDALEAASRRLGFMKECYDAVIEVLKENATFDD